MATPTDPYDLVGQVLDGQFRVDRAIGEGGFSVVYRSQHLGLDEPVAIKCLKLQAQLGSALVETFVRRFRDESKIHYRLSQGSLHIARSIAAGTTMAPATGALVPYLVLEWLEGFTLAQDLRARRERGERGRPLRDVIRLLDPVAEAMAFAHAQGVVHRDLNPSNVFVAHDSGGRSSLKVLDFGVAKVISDHALALGPRAATIGLIRMFTPTYGAPEQFQDSLGPIQPYTDVYAFALMVVELLVDHAPIDGDHLGEIADRVLDRDKRPTPRALGITIGSAAEQVLASALAVEPKERPGDIGQLWGMLKNAAGRDSAAPPRPDAKSVHPARISSVPPPRLASTPPPARISTPPPAQAGENASTPDLRRSSPPRGLASGVKSEIPDAGRYGYVAPREPAPEAPDTLRHGAPPPDTKPRLPGGSFDPLASRSAMPQAPIGTLNAERIASSPAQSVAPPMPKEPGLLTHTSAYSERRSESESVVPAPAPTPGPAVPRSVPTYVQVATSARSSRPPQMPEARSTQPIVMSPRLSATAPSALAPSAIGPSALASSATALSVPAPDMARAGAFAATVPIPPRKDDAPSPAFHFASPMPRREPELSPRSPAAVAEPNAPAPRISFLVMLILGITVALVLGAILADKLLR